MSVTLANIYLILAFNAGIVIGNTFGGLDELSNLAGSLEKLFSGDDCKYTCPNGASFTGAIWQSLREKPVVNPDHKPSSNGCGAFGIEIKSDLLPQMTPCCDKHDYCYDTCGKDKAKCDESFKKCLTKMCSDLKGSLSTKEYSECEFLDKAFVDIVETAIGCLAFKNAQSKVCSCSSDLSKTTTERKSSGKPSMFNSFARAFTSKTKYYVQHQKKN